MTTAWKNTLEKALIKQHGNTKGKTLANKYSSVFPASYTDDYTPAMAQNDIGYMENLSAEHPLAISFYHADEKAGITRLHLRLFQWQQPIPLSDILPMLENLDLRTDNEHPYKIILNDKQGVWISDFAVMYSRTSFDIEKAKDLFQDAFSKIYVGLVTNDSFNKLVLGALLSWREITILRMYAKYLHQIGFRFSHTYIEKALTNNPAITRHLVDLFIATHDPKQTKKAEMMSKTLRAQILAALEGVPSLDEDIIIRRLLELIQATLRTNYFQLENGKPKDYLSVKLLSAAIPDLPLPKPQYEIFVYSTRFEGIHLRNTKVARGGIRWSDRLEDYRTEVLGLMKAQIVKNAIIVPSGAKGGFVLKAVPTDATRAQIQTEVIYCYKQFICGLLDLTDNMINGKPQHPPEVVCYDDMDPYLVVAADKGTATFSDIANDIAKTYGFWLDDAFASGGATGYDHKKIGITARGAWESVKRHFHELDIDVENTDITMVGIGDMSGDVFDNGALYTKHIKLLAAFDHRHIFLDPDPDALASYKERKRLFQLPSSSWEDYNPKLISKGGGVYKRSLKSIPLSTQVKKALSIEEDALPPNELIRAILKAPVDLLFNGGIGTYVKACSQTDETVGDRTNDYCRVNGNELRAKVVGEGGNLGFTQRGRIEYALNGGLINTDFIDNSAGVDCSDHEVNLKILLNEAAKKHKLSEAKRNALLASVTDEIAELVLHDNYNQALAMSFAAFTAKDNITIETNYINDLETAKTLNRAIEFLPDNKTLLERKTNGLGLTRPELAVLLAYTKINLKHAILATNMPEDAYLKEVLETAFPDSIRKKYHQAMQDHSLRRDIIATQLSNHIVNEMGITFVYRLQQETGATAAEIVRAHSIAMHIFDTIALQRMVASLNFKIPYQEQYEMLSHIRKLIELTTRWFLHGKHADGEIGHIIKHYAPRVKLLEKHVPELMSGVTKEYLQEITTRFEAAGLPKRLAEQIASYRAIYTVLNIIQVATENKFDLLRTAKVYFASGQRINLVWFRDLLAHDNTEGLWNNLARLTLRDELDISQRLLTTAIMKKDKNEPNISRAIDKWMKDNHRQMARWERILNMLQGVTEVDYTIFFIAVRELIGLLVAAN